MENTISLTELVDEITKIYQRSGRPFPYKDLHKIKAEYGSVFEHIISDLDMFAFTLWGYSSWGQELLKVSSQEAKKLQYICERSFFEIYPQYKAAEQFITADSTPDLYTLLQELEQIRAILTLLLERSKNRLGCGD